MAKDREGRELKRGDLVGVVFEVIEAQPTDGPGTNLVLRATRVPDQEHIPTVHINGRAVQHIAKDDLPSATLPITPAGNQTTTTDPLPPAA